MVPVQLCLLCPEFRDEVKEVKTVIGYRRSARCVASLIAFYHMQIGALTLKKDQPSSFNKHSGCLKVLVACENVCVGGTPGQTQAFCWFYQNGFARVTPGWEILKLWFSDYFPWVLTVHVGPDTAEKVDSAFSVYWQVVHISGKSPHFNPKFFLPFLVWSCLEWLLSEQK